MANHPSRRLLALLLFFVTLLAFPGCRISSSQLASPEQGISYRLFQDPSVPDAVSMELTIAHPGASREVAVALPAVYGPAGVTIPQEKLFTNFTVEEEVENGTWVETTNTLRRVRFDSESDPVVIRYRLKQGYPGTPFDRQLVFSPAIQKEYWYLSTNTSLLVPDLPGTVPVRMTWEIPSDQKGWKLLSSYGVGEKKSASVWEQSFETTMKEFFLRNPKTGAGEPSYSIIFMFGRSQTFQKKIYDQRCDLTIALYGLPDYVRDAKQLFDVACANIESQGAFWGDPGYAHYFVNFVTHPNPDNDRFGGYNLNRTFTSFIPQTPIPSPAGVPTATFHNLVAHLSHEFSHTWLRPDMFHPTELMRLYCMIEGGAEYFGEYFLLLEGVVDFQTHVARYNRFLREYWEYGKATQTAGIKEIEKEFWSNFPYQRQPYLRGFLLLHNWHAQIRKESQGAKGVNDFARLLVKTGWKDPITLDRLQSVSQTFLKKGVSPDILSAWVEGSVIEPDPNVFGPWCALKRDASGVPFFAVKEALLKEKGEAAAIAWFE